MQLTITDDSGNGIFQDYYPKNKLRQIGKLQEGKRNGTWNVKREDGSKKMQLEYEADSLMQSFCFENDGKTLVKGDCIFEKEPSFPGGVKGWTSFLQRTLNYPDEALNRGIQGVVKIEFVVNKDGTLADFIVLNSPDLSLSREVLRIMSKSPKWEPAIQFNEPVKYTHIQAISFYAQRETTTF